MVKRKVTLAEVLCAVYCLSKPRGVTRQEVIKFCVRRFGSTRDRWAFNSVLERAVDEGLLDKFLRRFRIPRSSRCIVWTKGGDRQTGHNRPNKLCRGRRNGGWKRSVQRKKGFQCAHRQCKRPAFRAKQSKFRKNKISQLPFFKQSSFYTLWFEETRKSEVMAERREKGIDNPKFTNKRSGVSIQKTQGSLPETADTKKKCRKGGRKANKGHKQRRLKRKNMKKNLRSRRAHRKRKSTIRKRRKRRSPNFAKSPFPDIPQTTKQEHRQMLQQVNLSASHSRSWDELNDARLKRQRENKMLMKNSQLVQKILTGSHAESWDNLNEKLRKIKETHCTHDVVGEPNRTRPSGRRRARSRKSRLSSPY